MDEPTIRILKLSGNTVEIVELGASVVFYTFCAYGLSVFSDKGFGSLAKKTC